MTNLAVGTTLYAFENKYTSITPTVVYSTVGITVDGKGLYDIYGNNLDLWVYSNATEISAGTYGEGCIYAFNSSSYTYDSIWPVGYDRNSQLDTTVQSNTKYVSNLSDGINTYIIKDAEARTSIANKQDTLVSGTNIKTVGGTSLLGSGDVAFPTVDQSYSGTSTNAQSGVAVKSAIDAAVSSVYKPAGSVAFANLPTPASTNLGYVYNVNNSFTTDGRFIERAGKNYPAGTNVVIVEYEYPTTTTYYGWRKDGDAGSDYIYTTVYPPQANDTVYLGNGKTDPREFTIYGKVISYDSTSDNFTYSIDSSSSTDTSYSRRSNKDIVQTGIGYFFDTLTGAFQPLLVSGTNIKTINNESILGSGNVTISASPSFTYDAATETLTIS